MPKWRWIGSSGGGSNCSPVSSDSVSQLRATQSIYSIKTDLEGGTQSKVLVIVGPGGTGESYLIDTVAMYLEISRENAIKDAPETTINRRHKQLVEMAFTVVAAANVGGVTIHNALEVNSKEITSAIPEKTPARLQKDWSDVTVLVIDEVSLLSPVQLFAINARLGTIFPSRRHLLFSGLYVILAGDPFQLGPIGGKTLWPRDGERPLSVQEKFGRDYYLDCDKCFELTIGQRNFGPFYDILSRVRVGATTQEDITTLNTRVADPYGPVAAKSFEDAVVVVGTNREAISCNEQKLQSACAAPSADGQMKQTVRVWSHVRLSKRSRNGRSKQEQARIISRCLTRERGANNGEKFVANAFCTFKGNRVRLTENFCMELNLYTGASGTVLDIVCASTVDPHETRQAAATGMSHEQCEVDMPVVILQLDEECSRGPSISTSAPRVIAVEARKFYIRRPCLHRSGDFLLSQCTLLECIRRSR